MVQNVTNEDIKRLIEDNQELRESISRLIENNQKSSKDNRSFMQRFAESGALAGALAGSRQGGDRGERLGSNITQSAAGALAFGLVGRAVGAGIGGLLDLGISGGKMLGRQTQNAMFGKPKKDDEPIQVIKKAVTDLGNTIKPDSDLSETIKNAIDNSDLFTMSELGFTSHENLLTQHSEKFDDLILAAWQDNETLINIQKILQEDSNRSIERNRKQDERQRRLDQKNLEVQRESNRPRPNTTRKEQPTKNEKSFGRILPASLGLLGLGPAFAGIAGVLAAAAPIAPLIVAGGAGIGAGIGAVFSIGGLGIAAGVKLLSMALSGVDKSLGDFARGIRAFEEIDGPRLTQALKAMENFSIFKLIGASFATFLDTLSFSRSMDDTIGGFARSMQEFEKIDGARLTSVGEALKDFPLFDSLFRASFAPGDSLFGRLTGAMTTGEKLTDFANGMKSLADLDATRLRDTADGVTKMSESFAAFNTNFNDGFFTAIGRSLTDLFGKDMGDVLKEFSEIGPGLKQAGEGMMMLKDIEDIDIDFQFKTNRESVDNLIDFAKTIVKEAGPEIDKIIKFSDGLSALQQINFQKNILPDLMQQQIDANRRLGNRPSQPVIAPINQTSVNQVNRGGDNYMTPLNSGSGDATFKNSF